jgi:hypothetical protein
MGFISKFRSNKELSKHIERTEQRKKEEKAMASFLILLNKKPDYEGLDFEKLLENFYDHIKIDSWYAHLFWKRFMKGDLLYYTNFTDISVAPKVSKERVFLICYILGQCVEWGDSDSCFEKGWAVDVDYGGHDRNIVMRIFVENSYVPLLESDESQTGNLFLIQSLIAYMLDRVVISEEAKSYFKNNLNIVNSAYADEKQVNEIFTDNISPSEKILSIEKYEKYEREKIEEKIKQIEKKRKK